MADINEELVKEAIKEAMENGDKCETAGTEQTEICEGIVEDIPEDVEEDEESEEVTEEASETEDASEEGTKASFFKKLKKKDELAEKDAEIADLKDRLLRQLAEFDNFRKRTEKEKSAMFDMGAKSIIEKLLPALDSFERGFATVEEEDKSDAFVLGMQNVQKQLLTGLADAGLKAIEAEGREFDPNLHNAVMHEENAELGENVVSQELQKGYMFKDSVVRHSMVKVAN